MIEIIKFLIDFILHIDVHLLEITSNYGALTYIILALIVFAETGFVFTPFLPGDSLLFAAGAISAIGSLNPFLIILVLILSAFSGDTVNYWVGHFLGKKIVDNPKIKFINQEHIDKTQEFYKKHGGKTIILARFIPIIRTFSPFVAGVGKMHYAKFVSFSIVGGIAWVSTFTLAGYFFGNIPQVKHNFSIVVMAIIVVSLLPVLSGFIKSKFNKREKERK